MIEQRRLAAIVMADIVGFSSMMAADEDGTLAAMRAHRNASDPVILNHGGRIVKSTGDGVLVEFPSAVAAVRACLEVQDLMRARNAELPEGRRMHYRLGVNLGDVVIDESGDVFGDGVNVAARLEPLADPGGIALSNAVMDAVRGKLEAEFVDTGEHDLKNIPRPVRVWRTGGGEPAAEPARSGKRVVATLAVLPFDNMSADPEQDYFADGLTEDLLTALAHEPYLAVISRNSSFAYRGAAKDIRTIARELDATHVMEGSVRKSGTQIRVTAQLIDAETGHHVWAERYDRDIDDIFELQDELVAAIAAKLRPSLWEEAVAKRVQAEPRSVDAWDLYLRAQHHYNRHTIEDYLRAIEFAHQALRLEPDLVAALAVETGAWLYLALNGWRSPDVNPWEKGFACGVATFEADPNDYGAMFTRGMTAVIDDPDLGIRLARQMIEMNPQGFAGYYTLGATLNAAGRPGEAVDPLTEAWRLGRHEPVRHDVANDLAWAHYMVRQYESALSWGEAGLAVNPNFLQIHLVMAAAHAQLGRADDGGRHVEEILRVRPNFTVARYRTRILYRDEAIKDHICEGLLNAGLPS